MSWVPDMVFFWGGVSFFLGKRNVSVVSCISSKWCRHTANEIINISDSRVCVWGQVSHPVLWNPDNTLSLSDRQSRRAKWRIEPSPSTCFPYSCPPSQSTCQAEFPLRMPEPILFPTLGAFGSMSAWENSPFQIWSRWNRVSCNSRNETCFLNVFSFRASCHFRDTKIAVLVCFPYCTHNLVVWCIAVVGWDAN